MTRGSYFCIEWSGKVSPRRCEPRGGGWEGSYDEVREESFAGNRESDCKGRRREQAWPGRDTQGKSVQSESSGGGRVPKGVTWSQQNVVRGGLHSPGQGTASCSDKLSPRAQRSDTMKVYFWLTF